MTFRFRVVVRLKSGILDVQGAAIKRSLDGLGFLDVTDVRIGKIVEVAIDAAGETDARRRVDEMCTKLLANPILENYTIETADDHAAAGGGLAARGGDLAASPGRTVR